jgi:DNA modification methylase
VTEAGLTAVALPAGTDILGRLDIGHDMGMVEFVHDAPTIDARTWFTIEGTLDQIEFEGPSFFRFPEELARLVIDRFSKPGYVVLDPFCGFGTTLVAAQTLGRRAIGIEKDEERFAFASGRIDEPNRVLHASALDLDILELPRPDLVLTSPPYTSFREWDDTGFQAYWNDFDSIFSQLARLLGSVGRLVIDISNVREVDGQIRPVAFEAAHRLPEWFRFDGEIVRCNTGSEVAGPGYNHAYLLVYSPKTKSVDL